MDLSRVFYLTICLSSITIAANAEKKNKKWQCAVSALLLILFSGLRSKTVGIDTSTYYYGFMQLLERSSWSIFRERGFRLIASALMNIFHEPSILVFLFAFATIGLFYYRFWELRNKYSFSWMVAIFVCLYYARSMNIMRQYMAWALIFWGTRYLEKEKKVRYFILVVLTSYFVHLSSVAGLFFMLFNDKKSRLTVKRMIGNITMFLAIVVFLIYRGGTVLDEYVNYQRIGAFSFGLMSIIKIFSILFILVTTKLWINRNKITELPQKDSVIYDKATTINYILGIGIISLEYFSTYIGRVGLYFLSYEFLFWGKAVKSNRTYKILLLVILAYSLYATTSGNGYGIFPYRFVFTD